MARFLEGKKETVALDKSSVGHAAIIPVIYLNSEVCPVVCMVDLGYGYLVKIVTPVA